ncbi:hypothetical protein NliqN6_5866 [Naganishia liquefaciens]|uniref:J domain-containing protein n=1 Tax=Naganishia liquefaciens TaxID=104408 RepID=A0A8H3U0D1_9TREE|nr:hypothetical protein NliqN6_5866 [Naganishia liquefaciens]
MSDQDPIHQFFTPQELVSPYALYTALALPTPPPTASKDAITQALAAVTPAEIRTAYRRAALKYHPDKHASKEETERKEMERAFQRVGFAFAVLSDEARRKRYDTTGRTTESEGMFEDAAAMGSWEAYFEAVYQRVDKKMLDEDKKRYQGSEEELQDLTDAYTTHAGSLPDIMAHIPHSTPADEPRFIQALNDAIAAGTLESLAKWKKTSTDKKARDARARKAKKEEQEAESAAREMGVWDEFYGNGKPSTKAKRGTKRKDGGDAEEDVSGLAALIAKRQTSRASAFDALLEKYGGGAEADEDVVEFSGKRGKKAGKGKHTKEEKGAGEVDVPTEEEFQRLQDKLFEKKGDNADSGKRAKRSAR